MTDGSPYFHSIIFLPALPMGTAITAPGQVAPLVANPTHELEVTGSLPACSKLSFQRFSPPPLMHVRKVVTGFGKKCCVSNDVRKPENTLMFH